MEHGPFDDQTQDARRQVAGKNGQRLNRDERFFGTVTGVKVWRVVIIKKHLDHNPKNREISGTGRLVFQCGENIDRSLVRRLEVERIGTEIDLFIPDQLTGLADAHAPKRRGVRPTRKHALASQM